MDWFRWWHGTVTDPKFQSVARKTGYPVGSVIAVWAALLECASNATQCNADATRGNVASFHCNDFDVLLGFEDGTVQSIFEAMKDRGLIVGNEIARWNDRQPKREDSGNPNTGALSSTERSRLHRERKKHSETTCNDMQRNATLGNDRLDKSREEEKQNPCSSAEELFAEFWSVYPRKDSKKTALKAFLKIKPDAELHARILAALSVAKSSRDWVKDDGQFIPLAASWLNAERWTDEGTKVEKEAQGERFVPAGKTFVPGVGFVEGVF